MKKSLLLLIPALFLIASCGDKGEENNNQNPPMPDPQPHVDPEPEPEPDPEPPTPKPQHCPEGECVDADQDAKCDICGYPVEYQHAKSVGGDPKAPFILKVGEQKRIKAVLDPMPTRAIEKTFKWKTSNSSIATLEVDSTDTQYATVCGVKAGVVTFTATNDYSPDSLYHIFNATVVDFDEENMNLWEYSTNDKNQFGYTSDNKSGVASGTAVLNGISWEFTRSEVISLNTSKSGMLGFGKGSEPETMVKLVNHNVRKVKKIQIESCSANGLANLTVKVGDKEIINTPTPSSNEDKLIPIVSDEYTDGLSGDISIQFDTPEFDPSRIEDPTYQKPGCVYIKSIWITYEPEIIEYETEKTYDFASMYADTESEFYKLVPSSAAAKVYEDDDFVISFAKIAKPADSDKNPNCAKTNADIEIFPKDNKEVIKTISFEYAAQTKNNNHFDVYTSVLGGAPYTTKIASGDNSSVSAVIYDANINAIKLAANTNYNVALKTLTIKTVAGEHAIIDSVAFTEGATPTKLEYNDGDLFDPTGLGEATVKFTNTEIPDVKISTDSFTYYDGPSYDEPEDHSGKKTTLSVGTTYIYAVYKNFEIKIEGLTVELVLSTFSKVKSVSELNDGTYLITCPSKKAILKGSADTSSTFGASKYIDYVDSCEFGDEISLNQLYENEVITFTLSNNVYHLSTLSGKNIGMTGSNGTSVAKSPEFIDWNISIDESGYATMSIIDTAKENAPYYYGYGSTTFKFTTTSCSNVVLYKLAN